MAGNQPVSWLMFFTFAATIFAIAGAFICFLRSRHNRDITADALASGDHPTVNKGADGALPDLLGVTGFAIIALPAPLPLHLTAAPAPAEVTSPSDRGCP